MSLSRNIFPSRYVQVSPIFSECYLVDESIKCKLVIFVFSYLFQKMTGQEIFGMRITIIIIPTEETTELTREYVF